MSDREEEIDPTAGDFDDFAEEEEVSAPDESDDEEAVIDDDDDDQVADVEYESLPPPRFAREESSTIEVIPENDLMTSDFLSPTELAAIISCRAEQLKDSDPFLPPGVKKCSHDPVAVARQELRHGLCPLIIQRERSHDGKLIIEERAVRELQLPYNL